MMQRLAVCFLLWTGVVTIVSATCQQDLNSCQTAYQQALPQTHSEPGALCRVGNTYISCLRNVADVQLHPDCASLAGQAVTARKAVENMLRTNATGCMLCTSEVDNCQAVYQASISQNDPSACKGGQKLILCLRTVDEKPECSAEKPRLETTRRKTQEKLRQKGCDTGETCQQGVQTCTDQQHKSAINATTHAQQCKVSDTYYHCLLAQQCSGEFEKDVKRTVDNVVKESTDLNCTVTKPDSNGVGAEGLTHTPHLWAMLAVAVAAILN